MYEEQINDSIKKILEEGEHEKEVAAAAFLKIYEAVDRIAEDPEDPHREQAKKHRKMLENVYAMVEVFDYGRTD